MDPLYFSVLCAFWKMYYILDVGLTWCPLPLGLTPILRWIIFQSISVFYRSQHEVDILSFVTTHVTCPLLVRHIKAWLIENVSYRPNKKADTHFTRLILTLKL